MPKTLILIPSRLAASRLPGKPLLKINGLSIISHVFRKAQQSKIGDVYVCTGDKEIYEDVINNGGNCILTNKDHNTGTDSSPDRASTGTGCPARAATPALAPIASRAASTMPPPRAKSSKTGGAAIL